MTPVVDFLQRRLSDGAPPAPRSLVAPSDEGPEQTTPASLRANFAGQCECHAFWSCAWWSEWIHGVGGAASLSSGDNGRLSRIYVVPLLPPMWLDSGIGKTLASPSLPLISDSRSVRRSRNRACYPQLGISSEVSRGQPHQQESSDSEVIGFGPRGGPRRRPSLQHQSSGPSSEESAEIRTKSSTMATLHQAAGGNQERHLVSLLSLKNSDPNRRDELDRTPLIMAARKGNERCVQILLDCPPIDISASARGGVTALHVAAFEGHAAVAKQLVGRGLRGAGNDIRSSQSAVLDLLRAETVPERFTALHAAANTGCQAVLPIVFDAFGRANLSQEVLVNAANARDCIGWAPLHHAAWHGHAGAVQELLAWKPVRVNAEDGDGFTALHLAVWKGHDEIVRMLLNHTDQEEVADVEPNKEARSNLTTLDCVSTMQEDVDWEQLPRPRLADYTLKEQRSKITALHYAVEYNREEVVTLLVGNPSIDVHLENSDHKSAFDLAIAQKNSTILWELLDGYMERFEVYEKLRSALSNQGYKNFISKRHEAREKKLNNCADLLKAAIEKSKFDDVFYLLEQLKIELTDMNNAAIKQFPKDAVLLHHAAFAGLEKLVQILADIPGMEVNVEDNDHRTPLHYAAVAGHAAVVKVLIANSKCRANSEDKFGRSALEVAVESGKRDVEKLLLDRSDVKDYVERFYRHRQVVVEGANTVLVGAALIASVTFGGWLQPPGGFTAYTQNDWHGVSSSEETYNAVDMTLNMRVFWVFNSLSFFGSIATIIVGASIVVPPGLDEFIWQEVKYGKRSLVATSALLLFSVVFFLGAFVAAGYASLPHVSKYQTPMTFTAIFGLILCTMSVLWLLKRLYGIRPTWCRKFEAASTSSWQTNRKDQSARDLFRNRV